MRKGFIYLVAIMGWFTRKVLAFAHLEHAKGRVLPRGPERGQPIPFTGSGQRCDKDCVFCRHPHRSNCRRIGRGNRRITWSRQGEVVASINIRTEPGGGFDLSAQKRRR